MITRLHTARTLVEGRHRRRLAMVEQLRAEVLVLHVQLHAEHDREGEQLTAAAIDVLRDLADHLDAKG